MFREYPDIMSVKEVAEAMHIGPKAVYSLVKGNKLACLRIGKTIKIPKQGLIEYVNTSRNNIVL